MSWRGCGRRHRMPRRLLGRVWGSVEVGGDHALSRIIFCNYSQEPVDCLPPRRILELSPASAAAFDARARSSSRSLAATSFVSSAAEKTGPRVGPRARSRAGPRVDPRTGPRVEARRSNDGAEGRAEDGSEDGADNEAEDGVGVDRGAGSVERRRVQGI